MRWIRASALVAAAIGALLACGEPPQAGLLARSYVDAVNKKDVASLEAILTDDVVWQAGAESPLMGKAAVMDGHRREAGVNTWLALVYVEPRGDTLVLELMESSDMLREMGVNEVRRAPRLVVRDGRIAGIERLAPSAWDTR